MVDQARIAPGTRSEFYRLRAQMSTLSEVSAARSPDVRAAATRKVTPGRVAPHSASHKHAQPESAPPPGAFSAYPSLEDQFNDRGERAIANDSDAQLRDVNRWGWGAYKHATHGSEQVAESDMEFQRRIVRDYEGVTAPEVARVERSNVKRIREVRTKQGRTARFGHKIAGKGLGGG